ncbi:MAG TPA: hypothetical protein VGH84_00430 [Steroidobacteraceae bacterium]|jgi:hypothetical protein
MKKTAHEIPSLSFALQRTAFAVLAVAITLLTTQTIVASATEPYYPAATVLVADGDYTTAGSITVALAR